MQKLLNLFVAIKTLMMYIPVDGILDIIETKHADDKGTLAICAAVRLMLNVPDDDIVG